MVSNLENSRRLEGWLRRRVTKNRTVSSSVEHGPGDVDLIRVREMWSSEWLLGMPISQPTAGIATYSWANHSELCTCSRIAWPMTSISAFVYSSIMIQIVTKKSHPPSAST
jgi:hypothetical protein